MTNEQLQEIIARHAAATPGEWYVSGSNVVETDDSFICGEGYQSWSADAEFIAHAHQDIPALVAEVERLNAENADIQRACEEYYCRARAAERENAYSKMTPENGITSEPVKITLSEEDMKTGIAMWNEVERLLDAGYTLDDIRSGRTPRTRGDRIRAMTDEELAKELRRCRCCAYVSKNCGSVDCADGILAWLRQPEVS